jgi:hypothetical protein
MRQKLSGLVLLFFFFGVLCCADPSPKISGKPWQVLRAFLVSYPDRISDVDYDPVLKDWFLVVGGTRLYWADGRLLPADQTGNRDHWRAYVDYLYPAKIPDPATFSPETIAKLNADVVAESRSNSTVYNVSFYDLIYDGATRSHVETHIEPVMFLGKRVSVHTYIIGPLHRVEKRIEDLARTNRDVRTFIDSIYSVEGYSWREIADSPSRSNHSWGFAVDILPKHWGSKNIYWNWVSSWNDKWMLIPLSRRWMPPDPVISAFEAEGFIWGGKWLLWDDMHFEYRPELIYLKKWGYRGDLHE